MAGFSIDAEPSSETGSSKRIARETVVTGSAVLDNSDRGAELHGSAPIAKGLDIDTLAYCVAVAETGNCTTGMGVTKRNCFGIMTWPNGIRTGKTYLTKDDSYVDFKRIWLKSYKTFPTYSMAVKWTGNDNAQRWLNIVTNCYYE